MHLSNKEARALILHLQGLTAAPHRKQSRRELLDKIIQLGFVQIDSIQWVERAHHMILFARNQTYRPSHLKSLAETDQLLFEGWTHDASFIPTEFYRYWRHKFERNEERIRKKFVQWQGEGFLSHCEQLKAKIARDGRIRSRDIEKPAGAAKLDMWQWHDGKAALEFLWRTGQIGIAGRDAFQKIYDLCPNTINPDCFENRVTRETFIDWACRSAIERLGFGTPAEIARYWDLLSIQEVKDWLTDQGKDAVRKIVVEPVGGNKPVAVLARADIGDVLKEVGAPPARIRALSPFDPVIRNRDRLERLFGFDYRIEIYVPEAKRKYGYYVFPLLEKDRLIGRVDMRADRKTDTLEVKKLWLESKVRLSAARLSRLEAEFARQAHLANVGSVIYLENWATQFVK